MKRISRRSFLKAAYAAGLSAAAAGALSACGSAASSTAASVAASAGSTAAAEPTNVVFAMKSFNVIPSAENIQVVTDEVNRYIRETYPDVNIALEWKLYGPAEYDNKINLMMSSGEQLDLFIPSNLATSLATEQLADVTDALDKYGKEMVDLTKQYCGDSIYEAVKQDGKIMAMPANKNMVLTPILSFDADMLDATGFTKADITDLASLEPIFDKLLTLYPDVYPFVSTDLQNKNLPYYFYSKESIDSIGNDYGVVINGDGKVVNLFETDLYKELCVMMKRWHDKGYMPADLATGTMTGMEYMKAGKGFCTYASYGRQQNYDTFGTMLTARYGRRMDNTEIATGYLTTDFASATIGVPSTSKCVDAAVQMMNIITTDEYVYNTLLWGIEGQDYVVTDKSAKYWVVSYPEGLTADTVPYCAFMTMGEFGTESLMWGLDNGLTQDAIAASKDFAHTVNTTANRSPYYGFRFDASSAKTELTALNNAFEQYAYPLMCGSVDVDSTLTKFNDALKKAGLDTIMAEKQKQLDAWLANH